MVMCQYCNSMEAMGASVRAAEGAYGSAAAPAATTSVGPSILVPSASPTLSTTAWRVDPTKAGH
jgi:hypothetical protein